MRKLLATIACAALLVGCAVDQETTIDPTAAGSMGASGSGSVALPTESDQSSPTNAPGDALNPVDGSSKP